MSDLGQGALAEALSQTLDGLLGRRIVLFATALLGRLPWALRVMAFSWGLVAIALIAGALGGEPRALREVDVWGGLLLAVTLIAYQGLAVDVKNLAGSAIIPALSATAVARAQAWSARSFVLRRQGLVCGGVALLTALPLVPALHVFVGHFGLVTVAFLCFGSAVVTSHIYIPASVSLLSLLSTAGRVELFPLDPNQSPMIRGLRRLGQRTVVVTAAMATVGALGPLLLPGLGAAAYVLAAMVLFGGVLASVAQFFVQQYAIGALIGRARGEAVSALQRELTPLFERRLALTEEERSQMELLLGLYDRVVQIQAKGFTLWEAARFAGPLLVPMVTLILSSLHIEIPDKGLVGVLLHKLLSS